MKYWTKEWYHNPASMTEEPRDPAGALARSLLPPFYGEEFYMHGAVVTAFDINNGTMQIGLDVEHAYTSIDRISLTDCEILEQDTPYCVGLTWEYDEIYYINDRFELHIMLSDDADGLYYLTVAFHEMLISHDEVKRESDKNLLDMLDLFDQGKYFPKTGKHSERMEELIFWKKGED